ncbi:MAG TPA: hypothetical protein VJ953_08080 [Saprospiraceae bacterium]|nr:hypothetical protein [Saprospiraceae bacterium]
MNLSIPHGRKQALPPFLNLWESTDMSPYHRPVPLFIISLLITMSTTAQILRDMEQFISLIEPRNGQQKVILQEERHFEAPNWFPHPSLDFQAVTNHLTRNS